MADYISDEEQVERIKRWWNEYGVTIMLTALVVFVAFFGYKWWQGRQTRISGEASMLFERLAKAEVKGDEKKVAILAKNLIQSYQKTPYAALAQFIVADDAIKNKVYDKALESFSWVVDNTRSKPLAQIARIRKARILLEKNKGKEALSILSVFNDKVFLPIVDELKGDAYLQMKKATEAKKAYENAWNAYQKQGVSRSLVKLKLQAV